MAAQRVRLPQITGFLVAGVLAGPHVLSLLDANSVKGLWFVDQACLSVIAMAAGAELQWEQLDKIKKQVLMITLGISSATWVFVFVIMLFLAPLLAAADGMTFPQICALCSLCATLMMARSPASAIAVLQDTGGKGPFCSLVMAVVIVKDVLTIVAFAINIEVARTLFSPTASHLTWASLSEPFISVVISAALGSCGSAVVVAALRITGGHGRHPALPYISMAVTAVLSTAIFELASYFEAEPLLACAVTGLLTTNALRDGDRDGFQHTLEALMPNINLAFFSLAGASLKLAALLDSLWLASVVFVVRVAAIYGGSSMGCWLSDTPPEHGRRMWQSMLTQAGVALGLARMVTVRFPIWGPHFQTLMVSIIILNLCIGPPLFRRAIVTIGESRREHGKDDSPASSTGGHSQIV